MDPSGKAVPGATVTLTSEATKDIRSVASGEAGAFSFQAIPPGSYAVKAAHPGFKTFERSGVIVTANEHVALGLMVLQVGAVTETVIVSSKAARVETDSSDLSEDITTSQLGNLTARGRDMVSLLRTVPGSVIWLTRIPPVELTVPALLPFAAPAPI
jgi:hypothetical protein